jgi:uncharacterized membrane protein
MKRNRKLLLAIAVVAVCGALVATYDFIARLLHVPLFCPFAGNGCDIVQDSPYAVVFGVPLSFWGIIGFASYVLFSCLATRSNTNQRRYLGTLAALAALQLSGMAYFSYIELTVIRAVCSICVFSAALHVALAVLILLAIRKASAEARAA